MIALGLGSNLAEANKTREDNIIRALKLLDSHPQIKVVKISSLYHSEPVGFTEQPDFLNCAALITTSLPPGGLLEACLGIERQMSRVRTIRWGPRNIDIDLLFYGDTVLTGKDLELPHPRIAERKFVLLPLIEIAADFPASRGMTPRELLGLTGDKTTVVKYCSPLFESFLRSFETTDKTNEPNEKSKTEENDDE